MGTACLGVQRYSPRSGRGVLAARCHSPCREGNGMTSQRHWRRHGRIAIVTAFTTAVAGATLAGLPATATAAAPANPDAEVSIGKHDDQLLTEAIQRGQRTVKVLV